MNVNISILKKQLANVDTRTALLCICQKGAGSKSFYWSGQMWTANEALGSWGSYLLNMGCGTFGIILFYGGPPKGGGWYEGTVLSMLCDLILFEKNTQHWSVAEKLMA